SVARGVGQRNRLRLDRDAAFAFDWIGVQHLRFHLAFGQPAAQLDDAIGKRGLAVVDVGDDGEVADQLHGALGSASGDANAQLSHGRAVPLTGDGRPQAGSYYSRFVGACLQAITYFFGTVIATNRLAPSREISSSTV